jgi:hypothetical protein
LINTCVLIHVACTTSSMNITACKLHKTKPKWISMICLLLSCCYCECYNVIQCMLNTSIENTWNNKSILK